MLKPYRPHESLIMHALFETLCAWHAHEPEAMLIPEFAVGHGSGYADVAVVNELLHGYEIKSEADNLRRLDIQVPYYNRMFHRCTLVVAAKHMAKAREAIPTWWGLISFSAFDSAPVFTETAIARPNPCMDLRSQVRLLWRAEALALLDRFDKGHKLKWQPREILYMRLLEVMADLTAAPPFVNLLEQEIANTIRRREDWQQWRIDRWREHIKKKAAAHANH